MPHRLLRVLALAALIAPLLVAATPSPPADAEVDPVVTEAPMTTETATVTAEASLVPQTLGPATAGVDPTPPARVARAEGLESFVLIGFTWRGDAVAPARFRVHRRSGWSEWRPVTRSPDHAPDEAPDHAPDEAPDDPLAHARERAPTPGEVTSDPLWVGWADGWELGVDGDAADIRVHLVRPDGVTPPQPEGQVGEAAGGTVGAPDPAAFAPQAIAGERPVVRSRSSWGARPPRYSTWVASSLRQAVLHHTGSGESTTYAQSEVPAMLRAMQAYHMDANGWQDLGYNFVVDRFGRIWEGRDGPIDKPIVGAHAFGLNTGSVGIALLGDFTSAPPSQAARDAAVELVAWKLFRHGADPRLAARVFARSTEKMVAGVVTTMDRVVGHRDLNTTSCPGDLQRFLPGMRAAIVARFTALVGNGAFTDRTLTQTATGHPVIGDFDGDGADDIFWYREGARSELWRSRRDGTFAVAASYDIAPGYATTVLDWDGDGSTDIIFYGGPGPVLMLQGSRSGAMTRSTLPVTGDYIPVTGDFNGDGDDDIVWYSPTAKDAWIWASTNGGAGRSVLPVPGMGGPFRPAVGDFNGDGRADIFWYGPGDIVDRLWYGVRDLYFDIRPASVGGDYWPLVADLNGDQRDDIVWTTTTLPMPLWWGGDTFVGSASDFGPQQAYRTVDVNGGGTADVITVGWDGTVTTWLGSHSGAVSRGRTAHLPVTLPLTGDFNGDGRTDVIWWNPGQPSTMWLGS